MKNEMMKLPTNCAMMSEEEMMYVDGGFTLDAKAVVAGVAVLAVGALGVNMLNWFTGNSDTNFIQDSLNAGANFINGSLELGQNILNALMGK